MTDFPLISCIMPTRGRRAFVERAITLFHAQAYPHKELIIVDNTDLNGAIGHLTIGQKNVRYIYACADVHLSIGTMRNLACSLAHGEIICMFDDDDYYGSHRLSKQVEPILKDEADCSAMKMSLLLDANDGTLWMPSDDTHRRCFKQDIHYGTLMFKASYWQQGTHYANVQVGEDRRFVHALLATDARLARIVDPGAFIYVLHGGNTTSDMRLAHPDGWQQVSLRQYIPEEHWKFYAGLQGVSKI